jgi:hypothetical protein
MHGGNDEVSGSPHGFIRFSGIRGLAHG